MLSIFRKKKKSYKDDLVKMPVKTTIMGERSHFNEVFLNAYKEANKNWIPYQKKENGNNREL